MFYLLPMCATFIPFSSTEEVLFASVCLCVGRITSLIFFFLQGLDVWLATEFRLCYVSWCEFRNFYEKFLQLLIWQFCDFFPMTREVVAEVLWSFLEWWNKPISASRSGSRHFNGIFATEGIFWDQLPGGTLFLRMVLLGHSFSNFCTEYHLSR